MERLIGLIDATKQDKSPYGAIGNRKSLISLKPPLPNSGGDGESFTFNGVPMRKMSGAEDNTSGTNNGGNNTLHSRDNSSGNNSLLAGISGGGNGGGGPSPLAMGRKVKEYTG